MVLPYMLLTDVLAWPFVALKKKKKCEQILRVIS